MDDDYFLLIAIVELIIIHGLGGSTLLSAAITGMAATIAVLGISYLILLVLLLLYILDKDIAEKLRAKTMIEDNSITSFFLLLSLIFFIFCIGIGGNAATLYDLSQNSSLRDLLGSVSMGPANLMGQSLMMFFIFFFGPLAYVALAKGYGIKQSLNTLKLKISRRSALYFLAGIPAVILLNGALEYLLLFLQDLFGFQLAENVVAIGLVQGMNVPMAFTMAALTAFGEELFFRGFMQNRAGVWITTIVFTLSHISYGNLYEIIAVFVFSLIMGYGVKKTEDLGFSIGMHFTNNFATAIIINYFPHLVGI